MASFSKLAETNFLALVLSGSSNIEAGYDIKQRLSVCKAGNRAPLLPKIKSFTFRQAGRAAGWCRVAANATFVGKEDYFAISVGDGTVLGQMHKTPLLMRFVDEITTETTLSP